MLRQCDSGENTAWAPCSLPGKFQWDTIRIQHSVRLAGKPGAPTFPAPAARLPALPLPAEPALAARGPCNAGTGARGAARLQVFIALR